MLASSALLASCIRDTHARLMAQACGRPDDDALASMLSSWRHGRGAMPNRLGLSVAWFGALLEHHFPGADIDFPSLGPALERVRGGELADLRTLLLRHRAHESVTEAWIAEMVVVGCLGQDHLWQDLGLWARPQLTELMRRNFPLLAARNDRDMKWKKFLYKQLCECEGITVCRAPSCDACVDYSDCFAVED